VVALAFHQQGTRLVLVGREKSKLIEDYPDLVENDAVLMVAGIDLNRADDLERLMKSSLEKFGSIDVLVNVAGGYRGGTPVHETPVETWDFMMNLNARTVFLTSRAVVPSMLAQKKGVIINIGAESGLKGKKNFGAYSASKSAVVRLTESMSAELRSEGIRVNVILPGTIDTPQNRKAMPGANTRYWVKPDEIASLITFLASDAARQITGANIPIPGTA
jgi:NAD(P)-dependent dehydrogenase (short-subunit alcohol dehydrogenase family)